MINPKIQRKRNIMNNYALIDYIDDLDIPSDEFIEENIEYIEHDIEVE